MPTLKKIIISILLVFILTSGYQIAICQDGSPFITNYSSNDESMNENYSLCLDKNGVLLIANRKGILVYDASRNGSRISHQLPDELVPGQ